MEEFIHVGIVLMMAALIIIPRIWKILE